VGCEDLVMQDCASAQAAELIRALRHQLLEMTHHLAWVESRDVTGANGRASAMQLEADALRRDIAAAQMHIDRLQRRYLSGGGDIQQRPVGGQPRAMVGLQVRQQRSVPLLGRSARHRAGRRAPRG
jgi:hypothetical protein